MKIDVLALDGVFDTGLATVLDCFATANELAPLIPNCGIHFDVALVGMRRQLRTAQGMKVPLAPLHDRRTPDWVIVPALGAKMAPALEVALKRADIVDASAMLRQRAGQKVGIAAACVSTFVLAESGLLDHHEATTTWWLAPLFRRRYPTIRLNESRMIVPSGMLLTAGAALSHIDMALWLIRQASPALASMTARYLIVDHRTLQSTYVIADHLQHQDPLVERFERWSRDRLPDGFSLEAAAAAIGTSKRTLARRIAQALGKTPLSYFQDLRVERAIHLIRTSDKAIDDIANLVGYADGVTLRTLLRRKTGRGLREIRSSSN